jgi:hypothetical protein
MNSDFVGPLKDGGMGFIKPKRSVPYYKDGECSLVRCIKISLLAKLNGDQP